MKRNLVVSLSKSLFRFPDLLTVRSHINIARSKKAYIQFWIGPQVGLYESLFGRELVFKRRVISLSI